MGVLVFWHQFDSHISYTFLSEPKFHLVIPYHLQIKNITQVDECLIPSVWILDKVRVAKFLNRQAFLVNFDHQKV